MFALRRTAARMELLLDEKEEVGGGGHREELYTFDDA